MLRSLLVTFALLLPFTAVAQTPKPAAFDLATIHPVDPTAQSGRYIKMEGDHRNPTFS